MGAYCQFCGHRCFVLRVIPDGPKEGWIGLLATCPAGMDLDRGRTGHDHTTATNPAAHFAGCPQVGPVSPFDCDYCQDRARSMAGTG